MIKDVAVFRHAFPDRLFCKLTYADELSLTATTGGVYTQQYAINDLFDPDYTNSGTNHQPYLFDTYATMYNKYRVYGCKYYLYIVNNTDDVPSYITVNARDDVNTPTSTALQFMEQGNCKQCILSGQEGQNRKVLKGYFGIHKLLGISKKAYKEEPDLRESVSGSPVNRVFMNICHETVQAAVTSNVKILVKLKFYCEFSNKKILSQS